MTTEIDDGGPAFPFPLPGGPLNSHPAGMSLRDYFAAMAMQGMLANDAEGYSFVSCAAAAYEQADAMLAERSRK